jgi:signal transduction histidine kinase
MESDWDLAPRLDYFELSEADRRLLARLRPLLEKHADSLVAAFYRHLLSFPATRRLLSDPQVKDRLLVKQRAYLVSLGGPKIDADYVRSRRRIGEVHERIGLEPGWYLGAYAHYLSLLTPLVCEEFGQEPLCAERVLGALQRLLLFDAQIAMETYIEQREQQLEYLNRELAQTGHRLALDFETQAAELRRTTQRARAAERLASIGNLVAGLAHEIGTPMGVIQGHAKLLEPAVVDDKAKWRLRTIRDQITRISRIIEALLNMARPTRESLQAVDLAAVLDATLLFLSEKLDRRGIQVVRDLRVAPTVMGDPERLQQLFLNLFLNAADAMPRGGELRLALHPCQDGVEVWVADTGEGIPATDLPRVFDPFFTTKAAGEGNGLGLAVAQGIVTDHGGTIEVGSTPGKGTEFRIRLPDSGGVPGQD